MRLVNHRFAVPQGFLGLFWKLINDRPLPIISRP
jgi:hypothetical protein